MAGLTEYLREFNEDLLEYLGENQQDDPAQPFHGGPSPPVVIGIRARMS